MYWLYSCQGRTFWAFSLTLANAHINFCLLILQILKPVYCVKYIRILLSFIFCISQGFVVAHLKCRGKHGMGFVSNFREKVKAFWKSVYTNECRGACFYHVSICEGGLGSRNSVCPSVCLSVTCVDCDKSKWCTADILTPHEMAITLLL